MIASGTPDDGFHEVCAIVHDLDESEARLCRVLGYTTLYRGAADRGALDLMGIPDGTTGIETLVGDSTQHRGYIRLFAFPGHDTEVMRDGAQPWDSGGIFDINVRALGPIEPFHAAMTRAGFSSFGPITAWDFGPLSVKEVVDCDADGLAIALIERTAPPLTGFEHVAGHASHVFNSSQIVPSFDVARAFYVDVLGWKSVQESRWVSEGGLNCMGLPLDTARTHELRVGIYQQHGFNEGSVEIIEYAGESLDFSHAAPPNRGWAALRFPMTDIAGFLVKARRGGCMVLEPRRVAMQPYGMVYAGVALTPWGVRLEAYTAC